MIVTVPAQVHFGSPLSWVLAGIVAMLAIWGAVGLLQEARGLWQRRRLGSRHDWRRPPDGSGQARGDLWSGEGENFRQWLGKGMGLRGRRMRSPLLDALLVCSLLGNMFVAYLYRADIITITHRLWDRLTSAW